MSDLFISYTQKDGEIAASLLSRFDDAGLRCFLAERDLGTGDEWVPKVRQALASSKRVLLLVTPRSKDSLWVHAEAGAAWALEKPIVPALMFVEAEELMELISRYQAFRVETDAQVAQLIANLLEGASLSEAEPAPEDAPLQEHFNASSDWERILRVGPWRRHDSSGAIEGGGMYRYLLSHYTYEPRFRLEVAFTFLDWFPVSDVDNINAGIVLGWKTSGKASRYYHLLFTGEQLLLERVGGHGGDEYGDFEHLDEGVPFRLKKGHEYRFEVSVRADTVEVCENGQRIYQTALPERLQGRVGLRPWRSQVSCRRLEVQAVK